MNILNNLPSVLYPRSGNDMIAGSTKENCQEKKIFQQEMMSTLNIDNISNAAAKFDSNS